MYITYINLTDIMLNERTTYYMISLNKEWAKLMSAVRSQHIG